MQKQQDWNEFKNILCVRPDNLGDVIMTGPAIRALKQAVAGRRITLLASSAGAAIARFIPEIDEVILFDTPWVKNNEDHAASEVKASIEEIAGRNFDAAVIFTVYSQNPLPSAMICYMAGIRRIAGYCRENPYHLMSDWIPDPEPLQEIRHEVQRQMDLVARLGAASDHDELYLKISKPAEIRALKRIREKGFLPSGEYVIIHPGVSETRRQFPVEKLGEAARMLVKNWNIPVLITGTIQEKTLADHIVSATDHAAVSVAGELTLEELIVLIKNARLLISNNTGPVHIAAAVQTPVIVMYALTNPQHMPWKVKHKVFPFDVPSNMRSKNVVIEYAYQKAFTKKPDEILPVDIVNAVEELVMNAEIKQFMQQVLYL